MDTAAAFEIRDFPFGHIQPKQLRHNTCEGKGIEGMACNYCNYLEASPPQLTSKD